MSKIADIAIGLIIFGVIGSIIYVVFTTPIKSYVGEYCNPQNVCRYETFQYECPPTDEANIIIGDTRVLKPGSCKEQ